ncbi:Transposase IS200 like protein [uncultured archaeon]|nr:Transposase IS200 like protein [uncultured archaeon]
MLELRHANHCVYKIRYHMVLCIKYRRKMLLDPRRISQLKEIFCEIQKRYCFEIDAIGTDGDHVHIFVGAAPKYAPSRVMQILKSIAAKQMFKAFPEIKKELWGGEFWSDGGYIGTVGEGITAELIRDYIEKQGTSEEKEGYKQMNLMDFD